MSSLNDPSRNLPGGYVPPRVWTWDAPSGGTFADIANWAWYRRMMEGAHNGGEFLCPNDTARRISTADQSILSSRRSAARTSAASTSRADRPARRLYHQQEPITMTVMPSGSQ